MIDRYAQEVLQLSHQAMRHDLACREDPVTYFRTDDPVGDWDRYCEEQERRAREWEASPEYDEPDPDDHPDSWDNQLTWERY